MDNGGIWPGDEYYFESLKEKSYEERIKELKKELADACFEIENQKHTTTLDLELIQRLSKTIDEYKDVIKQLLDAIDDLNHNHYDWCSWQTNDLCECGYKKFQNVVAKIKEIIK